MANTYLKLGKLYNLTSTTATGISGANLMHAIYNSANTAMVVTIDNTYPVHIPVDGSVTFPNPITFCTVKTSATYSTGIILYS